MLTIQGQEVWPGRKLSRRDLRHEIGGQQQGGISTPQGHPVVLLFTGAGGSEFGYSDSWAEKGRTFRYFGEGQRGDMAWVRGNLAVRDHGAHGRDLHLFAAEGGGLVEYLGQMDCGGWEYLEGVPDLDGTPRRAIVFHLVRRGAPEEEDESEGAEAELSDQTLEGLRELALAEPARTRDPKQASRNVYERSRAVIRYALARWGGICEGCQSKAPFLTKKGRPYLECHHTTRLSDGGPDHPANVVAVCPNCHRRAHLGCDAENFNGSLTKIARLAEP